MSVISDLGAGAVQGIITGVRDIADDLITTDEELAKAELDNKRLDLERDKAHFADVANSRDANVKIQESANSSYLAKNVGYWLDLFIVLATFGMAYLIMFKAVPEGNKEVFYTAFGSLLTLCLTVVQWHRGSSSRSAGKDDTIRALSKSGADSGPMQG